MQAWPALKPLLIRLQQTNVGLMSAFLAVGLACFSASPALAEDHVESLSPEHLACRAQYVAKAQKRYKDGVAEKHLPRLFLPAYNPKDTVVIFTHGIFESPYFFKGVAQTFADQGYITMSILLPGHWQSDWDSMRTVRYKKWIQELEDNIQIAQCFGKKIIFAGHSLGGLLSIHAALTHPDITAGVMLWSPAVKIRTLPALGGKIGDFLGLNGNLVMGKPNLDEIPLYSPNAPKQISALIDYITNTHGNGNLRRAYRKLTAPTFLAYAEKDPAVDVDQITIAAHSIAGMKDVMYFPEYTGVHHGNVTKFPGDTYAAKEWDYNKKWGQLQARIVKFLKQNF